MEKVINLKTGLYDNNIGVLADNENLQISICGTMYKDLTYYLNVKIGERLFKYKFIDKTIEIPREVLKYGIIKAKVVAFAENRKIKEFRVEDLILEEIDGEIKVLPEIEQIRAEVNELIIQMANIRELCENTKELVIKLNGLTQKVGE